MVAAMQTPAGPIRAVGNPIKLPGVEDRFEPPPGLGEHNALLSEGGA
jgi:hypothetical protein